ncbi:MAG: Smr/MutS family protein, partial [Clostridia bacterium]|nr:Smr/MutS family protein [Clostridia bacterium]
HIREKGAFCAATTHYAELKAFALDTDGVVNASCEFDVDTLKPTYKLIIGTPGKSNAFAISGKLGLDEGIINNAKRYISSDNKRFEIVIEKLDQSRIEAEKYREDLKRSKAEFDLFRIQSEKKIKEELEKAKQQRDRAEQKARETIEGARASVSFVLDEVEKIRKRKAADMSAEELLEAKRRMRHALDESDAKYNSVDDPIEDDYKLPRPLVKGDNVKLKNIGKSGVLVSDVDKDGNCRVKIGAVTTKTNINNLKLLDDKDSKKSAAAKQIGSIKKTVSSNFKPELDIRGQLGDDGWFICDKYLDEAIVAGIKTVHIIHGKGTGALKNHLWSWFKTDKRIKSFRLGRYGEGDGGVTVIELK